MSFLDSHGWKIAHMAQIFYQGRPLAWAASHQSSMVISIVIPLAFLVVVDQPHHHQTIKDQINRQPFLQPSHVKAKLKETIIKLWPWTINSSWINHLKTIHYPSITHHSSALFNPSPYHWSMCLPLQFRPWPPVVSSKLPCTRQGGALLGCDGACRWSSSAAHDKFEGLTLNLLIFLIGGPRSCEVSLNDIHQRADDNLEVYPQLWKCQNLGVFMNSWNYHEPLKSSPLDLHEFHHVIG